MQHAACSLPQDTPKVDEELLGARYPESRWVHQPCHAFQRLVEGFVCVRRVKLCVPVDLHIEGHVQPEVVFRRKLKSSMSVQGTMVDNVSYRPLALFFRQSRALCFSSL